MGKYTGWFLVELEHATSHLQPEQKAQIQDEFTDHLDAAIQARLELGEAPDVAEHNAVKALGLPKTIAQGFGVPASQAVDPRVVGGAMACSASWVVCNAFQWHPLLPLTVIALLVAVGGLARALKLQPTPSRRTKLWACTLTLAILSVGLPLAQVRPRYPNAIKYPVADFQGIQQRLGQNERIHSTSPIAQDFDRVQMGEFMVVVHMSYWDRLQRGFVEELPAAEFGTGLLLLALCLPGATSRRRARFGRIAE